MYITVSGSSVFGIKWKTNFFEKKKSNRNSYPIKNIPLFVKGTENETFHKPQSRTRFQHIIMIQQLQHGFKEY